MKHYADITIYGRDGGLKLLVEVKSKRGKSREWAARLRRNMYAHGQLPRVPYFLVALPDRFYLWRDIADPQALVDPQYSVDPTSVLRPYFDRAHTSSQTVTGTGLEFAVSAWLEKLANGRNQPTALYNEPWLRQSGLLEAIRGGSVEVQALV